MVSIKYQWKNHKVHLPDFEAYVKSVAGDNYLGNSADKEITLWFKNEPSKNTKDQIQMKWDQLGAKNEQTKIELASKKESVRKIAMEQIPLKKWDEMIPAERKLILNQPLNNQDKLDLLKVYPI